MPIIYVRSHENNKTFILKERRLCASEHVVFEYECLKYEICSLFRYVPQSWFQSDMFRHLARTTAGTKKFMHQGRFRIIKNTVFIYKIIFKFE